MPEKQKPKSTSCSVIAAVITFAFVPDRSRLCYGVRPRKCSVDKRSEKESYRFIPAATSVAFVRIAIVISCLDFNLFDHAIQKCFLRDSVQHTKWRFVWKTYTEVLSRIIMYVVLGCFVRNEI